MKFSSKREDLLAGLQTIIGVVERRQTMPVLSNFLLCAENNQLSVTATDLELEVNVTIPVAITDTGSTTIPARKMLDICRGLPADCEVTVELQDQRARIASGRSRFTLSILPASQFPRLGDVHSQQQLTLDQRTLKQLLDRTYFAMAHHDVRYYLNGLLLVLSPNALRTVATDGHRLAVSEVEMATGIESQAQVIVPRKAVTELQRVLEHDESEVILAISGNHLQIQFDGKRFTSKLIDGRFPDYERVIPEPSDKVAVGDRELLRQALSRAAIVSNEKFRGVRLSLADNLIRIEAQNPEREEAKEEITVEYDSESVDIGFNVNYLMDALAVIDGDAFALEVTGPDSSGLLRAKDDFSSRYVVMPMRL